MTTEDEVLALRIDDAARCSGVGRTSIYQEIKAGCLRATKVAGRTVILRDDLRSWLHACRDQVTDEVTS